MHVDHPLEVGRHRKRQERAGFATRREKGRPKPCHWLDWTGLAIYSKDKIYSFKSCAFEMPHEVEREGKEKKMEIWLVRSTSSGNIAQVKAPAITRVSGDALAEFI